ncbi:hypothetical protein FACS1894186_1570 [Alphaproteobacteria bacterium]|nr:hypothetical protein FACS1894186_1570 [Alphaproteobacteria bacterium]
MAEVWQSLTGFDIFALSLCLASGLFAAWRGFVREALALGSWLAAGVAVYVGVPLLQPWLGRHFSGTTTYNMTVGFSIAVIVLAISALIIARVDSSVRGSALSGLDRLVGFVFGLVRGGIMLLLLLGIGLTLDAAMMGEATAGSHAYPPLRAVLDRLGATFPAVMPADVPKPEKPPETAKPDAPPPARAKAPPLPEEHVYVEEDRQELQELIDETDQAAPLPVRDLATAEKTP